MTSLFSYLITMFGGMFWLLRVVVAVTYTLGVNFPIVPLDFNTEIILLFVNLICFVLVIKRKLLGGLIYIFGNGAYFGVDIYNNLLPMFSSETIGLNIYMNLFVSFIAMILAIAVLLDLLVDKGRKANPKDKKTDWFFKNKDFDRKFDERADRNEYRL